MPASLSLQQTPAFSVPIPFILSAPAFGMLAALVLLWFGPEPFFNRWSAESLAVTHMLTLGFLLMTMVGAMQQLLPVLLGTPVPAARLFSVSVYFGLLTGIASLVSAWLTGFSLLFVSASVLLGLSIFLFIVMSGHCLAVSVSAHATRTTMLLALGALLVTVVLGTGLSITSAGAGSIFTRELTSLHMNWGLTGWVILLLMAVAYQVIPMFQITREYPLWHRKALAWTAVTGLVLMTIGQSFFEPWLALSGNIVVALVIMMFSATSLVLLWSRKRKLKDVGVLFWYLAFTSMMLACVLWLARDRLGLEANDMLLGVVLVVGSFCSAANGMMYRIVPFIAWLHLNLIRQQQGLPQSTVPNMKQLASDQLSRVQFYLHLSSLILLALHYLVSSIAFYPAALVFFLSQGLLLANLVSAVEHYHVARRTLLKPMSC
ncbi:MAG: hypothetical protein OEZ10_02770 [Gammaproteobacteria bacterium]|nr:hypothetical protein [Gammaproteobacteria bacterium]